MKCAPRFLRGILLASLAFLLAAIAIGSRSSSAIHLGADPLTSTPGAMYQPNTLASLPSVVFWAWERPEDLRFLDANDAGVAFFAKTIILRAPSNTSHKDAGGSFFVRPRLQPLRVSPRTPLIAVVRIENPPALSPNAYSSSTIFSLGTVRDSLSDREAIAAEIAELQNLSGVRAIQIDYDATLSERPFYVSLLSDVRRKLPPTLPLSITALASWCIGDPWLEQLPAGTIQEAVPMLFRMGPDSANVAKFLRSGDEFRVAACQGSLGISTDEFVSRNLVTGKLHSVSFSFRSLRQKRIYVFSPRAWTPFAAQAVLKEWQP